MKGVLGKRLPTFCSYLVLLFFAITTALLAYNVIRAGVVVINVGQSAENIEASQ